MIRILFFIEKLTYNGFIGGAEKVLVNLVNNMDQEKYEITVQTVFPESAAAFLSPQIHYKSIFPIKNQFYNTLFRIECELGVLYHLHMRNNYDVEVAFLEFCSTKVIASSTNTKAKKYAWVHCDLDIGVADKNSFARKNRRRYSRYNGVVCVSEKCKESFCGIFPEIQNVAVLHNVIDSEEILRKANEDLPAHVKKQKFTMATVARFSPPKNYARLLSIAKRFLLDGYDFELWIVGDGEQRGFIENYIQDSKLSKNVIMMGFQENPYPFMREADLLVCASNYEGFSTFVTEGLILGKAIITTDCSGMRELLGQSEYGVVVENSDQALYQGIKKILNRKDIVAVLAEKAALRGALFSKAHLVEETTKFLSQGCGDN